MIPVTKAFLPPLEEYNLYLKRIWENQWVTNRGPNVLDLEEKLRARLNVKNLLITNNGTVPIQIALKKFGQYGEIITTPFSYIATTSSIVWENCTPVYVDIHPDYLTIDESKIEEAITEKTTAILATHVFGNPCNVEAIEKIARKHNLTVIYDAAHCFGVNYLGKSIFEYGDISTCSFHATKIFHTGEGGAIFCKDAQLLSELFLLHNFGHKSPTEFSGIGINGKISELQAAMGLAVLPHFDRIKEMRRTIVEFYEQYLNTSKIKRMLIRQNTEWNYSYYPVIFENEEKLLEVQSLLNKENIFPRRYFYPSLNTVDYAMGGEMVISESISTRILCLPLYVNLEVKSLKIICDLINSLM